MTGLLERAAELERLTDLLAVGRAGRGGVAVVEGPPGIGKTRLLEEARAAAAGFRVLWARGGELERDFPWGVVRQLFERAVLLSDQSERERLLEGAAAHAAEPLGLGPAGAPAGAADASFAALHGLHWLTVNLAVDSPLLLVVDDLQWADDPSLRFLSYLARRVAEMPVVVVAAQRPQAVAVDLGTDGDVIGPAALSEAATAALVADAFAAAPDPEFARACHAATGGNPFLLRALCSSLRSEGVRPTADAAPAVGDAGPPAVARHVRRRLSALGSEAVRLARAVAILGTDTELRRAAALAGLGADEAARVADRLAAVDVLRPARPLEFVHPVVRAAVRDDMLPAERAKLHRRAAEVLADDPGRVAVHLLGTEPAGDEWVVRQLHEAAGRAFERGAPDAAQRFLERALAEPPPAALRASVLRDLGRVALLAGDVQALTYYRQAVESCPDPAERAAIGREGGVAAVPNGQYLEAVATLERALADARHAGDQELALMIEADLGTALLMSPQTAARDRARVEARLAAADELERTPGGRSVLCDLAFRCALGGHTADEAAALARRAVRGGMPIDPTRSNTQWNGAFALAVAEALDEAAELLEAVRAAARARGSALTVARASMFLGIVALRRGDIRAAIDEAQTALELAAHRAWFLRRMTTSVLVDALRERGDLAGAAAALAAVDGDGRIDDVFMWNFLLFARGRLRVAVGEVEAGLEDLLELGRRQEPWFAGSPSAMPWRSEAARALVMLGRSDEARDMAARELELAQQWGTARAIGTARHAMALAAGGDRAIVELQQAVAELEGSPAVLELAHALVDLGAALRRRGRRAAARDPLRRGIDIAHRCGANALAERGLTELHAAGGRPRRLALAGVDALTPSERRVAHLAATGMTNREIAQTLFVTLRTVEVHLTHAYAKLGITTRNELPAALALGEAEAIAAN